MSLEVYLPSGYDDARQSYPVIYGLPGCCGDGITPRLQSEADRLIKAGQIPPLIIVGLPTPGASESFIFDELIPFVDQHFRTLPGRRYRALFGHSASSGLPFSLALRHPEILGAVGAFASGYWKELDALPRSYDPDRHPLRLWIWHGRNDPGFEVSENMAARLEELGWEHKFLLDNGGHTPAGSAREAFLQYIGEGFAEVPMLQPPAVEFSSDAPLIIGAPAVLTVGVQQSLLADESQITQITVDLSEIGGPATVPLTAQEDGSYQVTTSFTVMGSSGLIAIPLHLIQGRQAQPYSFEWLQNMPVFPAEDRVILDETLSAKWRIENSGGAAAVEFGQTPWGVGDGQRAGVFQVHPQNSFSGWNIAFHPKVPIPFMGYRSLRFLFHPGEAITPSSRLAIQINGRWLQLLEKPLIGKKPFRLEGVEVDMDRKQWQHVEIPLELFGPSGRRGQIQSIQFRGDLDGAFTSTLCGWSPINSHPLPPPWLGNTSSPYLRFLPSTRTIPIPSTATR